MRIIILLNLILSVLSISEKPFVYSTFKPEISPHLNFKSDNNNKENITSFLTFIFFIFIISIIIYNHYSFIKTLKSSDKNKQKYDLTYRYEMEEMMDNPNTIINGLLVKRKFA